MQAKEKVPHGKWIPWLEKHCDFSLRTAQAYMQAARKHPTLDEAKAQRVALLPFRDALRELAEGTTRKGKPWEDRRAAVGLIEDKALGEVMASVDRAVGPDRFVESAKKTGWASDGRFMAKLSEQEREEVQQIPVDPVFQRVPPANVDQVLVDVKDLTPLRVLGYFRVPRDTFDYRHGRVICASGMREAAGGVGRWQAPLTRLVSISLTPGRAGSREDDPLPARPCCRRPT
jgi:hypothetical protein